VTRSLQLSLVFVFLIGHHFAILLKFLLLLFGGLDVDLCVLDLAFQILFLINKRTHFVLQLLFFGAKSSRLVAHLKLLFFPDVLFLELDGFESLHLSLLSWDGSRRLLNPLKRRFLFLSQLLLIILTFAQLVNRMGLLRSQSRVTLLNNVEGVFQ